MREFSMPLSVDIPTSGSLTDDILRNASDRPDAVAFSRRATSGWVDVTAAEFLTEVRGVAKGLIAAGIADGDRVALMSKTRYEWTLLDYAIWFVGGITVPIYETSSVDQVEQVLADSGATAAFAETSGSAERLTDAAREATLPVWVFDHGCVEQLISEGSVVADETLEARRAAVAPGSPATIIYTSGTTGAPRGCVLTHGNFMFELGVAVDELHELFDAEGSSTLLFLPLAHVFARIIQVGAVKASVRLGHSADVNDLLEDLKAFRPTFVLAVPRVFEKIFNTASQTAAVEGRTRTFERAVRIAISYSKALESGRPGWALRARHAAFDRLVYSRLRDELGGQCMFAISGGAPLGERLGHFYRGTGLVVLEGYGLTETTGALTVNLPETSKIGTVGRPLGGTTVRVADDGEILAKGRQVFDGYWNDPVGTAEVFSSDGWLHTGDLGEVDDEGFIRVTGRKKEIIVTAGGKNVSPTALEDQIRAHPLVSQCMVVGEGQPFIAALVTIDTDALSTWSQQRGKSGDVDDLKHDPELIAEVQSAVDDANKSVSQAEAVRKFRILPGDWTEDAGQLTPSLKLKRGVLLRHFREDVEDLYPT